MKSGSVNIVKVANEKNSAVIPFYNYHLKTSAKSEKSSDCITDNNINKLPDGARQAVTPFCVTLSHRQGSEHGDKPGPLASLRAFGLIAKTRSWRDYAINVFSSYPLL